MNTLLSQLLLTIAVLFSAASCSAEDIVVNDHRSDNYKVRDNNDQQAGEKTEEQAEEVEEEITFSPLTLHAHEAKEIIGNVCYMVFTSSEGFPSKMDQAEMFACIEMDSNPFEIDTIDLEVGREYAISIFHDENSNEQIDLYSDTLPIPKEGLGLSTNPDMRRRPTYDDAKFIHSEDRASMPMNLIYLFGK